MDFDLESAITILSRTPAVLRIQIQDLPQDWIFGNEGEGTWSPFDVIGHLIHGEKTDWIPRARIILSDMPDKTFEAFDRFAQFRNSQGKSLEELLREFESLRGKNIQALKSLNITVQDLHREGNHPALGKVTLAQLISTWVVHDLDHLGQVLRVVAKQHRDAVGPWKEYLSVLAWKSTDYK